MEKRWLREPESTMYQDRLEESYCQQESRLGHMKHKNKHSTQRLQQSRSTVHRTHKDWAEKADLKCSTWSPRLGNKKATTAVVWAG